MTAGRKEYELQMKLTAQLGSTFGSSFQGAMSTIKKLQGTLQNVKKVQGDISAYKKTQEAINATKAKVQEYESKHNALQSELAQTSQKEKDLQAALRETERTTGKDSEEYTKLQKQLQATRDEESKLKSQIKENERATESANDKIKDEEQKLLGLSEKLKAAGVNTDRLTQENDKLKEAYNRVKKAQEDYAKVNSAIEQNKQAISATKGELAKTIGVIGGAGAAFYKGFITPAANLQQQMSTVQALSGATGEDMERLNEIAKKMGATTKFTAVEAGQALEYMAMAGWKTNQMISGLPGIMNLAAASGEELGTVSDIVTDALTAFGMTAEDSGHFANVLAAASTNANTNVSMMGETFKYCAPLAGTLKWSVDDVAEAIGLMANAGVKSTNAGTALRSMMTRLATNAGVTKNEMGALEVLTEKLGVEFYGANGKVRDFKSIIMETRTAYSKLSQEEQVNIANKIAGKNALSGFMALMNATDTDLNKLTVSISDCDKEGGAASKMAGTRLDNLNGDITLAKSAWDGFATTIGELFLPNLREAVTKVKDFLNKANDFAQKNPELIKQIVKVAGGLAALKVGSLAGKLGFLELKGGILNVIKVFTGFRAKMAESAAAAATGGGKFAAFGKKIAGYFSGVKSSIGGVGTAINKLSGGTLSKIFGGLGTKIQSGILKPIGGIGDKIKGVFGSSFGKIGGVFSSIGSKIADGPLGKIAGKIGGVFSSLGKSIGPVLGGPLKALGGLFGGLFGKVAPIIAIVSALSIALLKLTGNDISSFIEPFKTAFEQLKPVLQTAMEKFQQLGKDLMPLIMDAAKKLAPLLGQIITAVLPVVIQLIQSLVPLIVQLVQDVLPPVLNIITTLAPLLTQVITTILPIAVQLLQMLLPVISDIATSVLPIVADIIKAILPVIVTLVQQLLPVILTILQAVMPIIQALLQILIPIVQQILPVVATVLNAILPLVDQLIRAVLPVLTSILQALMPIIQVLADLFSGTLGVAIQALMPIIESLTGVLKGIIDFITGVFTGDWEKAFGGIVDIAKNIWETIKNIFGGIIDFFKGIGEGIGNFFSNLFGGKEKVDVDADIPKFESGSDSTPDTFIAGDVNGKGGELVTGAKGRKVFTAAETAAIFTNIKAAKAINKSVPRQVLAAQANGSFRAAKDTIAERAQIITPAAIPAPMTNCGETKFEINYNPTIYVDGNKPGDLEEKLQQNNERIMQMFKEYLRQQKENERRTAYA